MKRIKAIIVAAAMAASGCGEVSLEGGEEHLGEAEEAALVSPWGRTITAEVVAIDQMYVYDRFGTYNPAGMIYALKRDVVAADPSQPLGPGNAALRPGKRPRPLVLRVNVNDKLVISFTNWLRPAGGPLPPRSPTTRHASIHVAGLQIRNLGALGAEVGQNPSSLAAPGETRTYELHADREGAFLMHSAGSMVGADAPGPPVRHVTHALFGAVTVEPAGSVAYRSRVKAEELALATLQPPNPDGTPRLNYDAIGADGQPILRMTNAAQEIVHGDLDAIVVGHDATEVGSSVSLDQGAFREFTAVFHDDLGAVQAFTELQIDPSFHSVRAGLGINYGAASLGAAVLANRQRVGPAAGCAFCKFEEFFLSSWANGDPALNIERDAQGFPVQALYPDDPANVHHGYLGDAVRFRNLHAGPRETHVFHLHGHQWLRSPGNDDSAYIDSQTLGPGAAYTYDIGYGGGGNRNLTAGDSIFHCHLYPHFAQGMWAIWRTHDAFEAGTSDRALPDGEIAAGTPTPAVVPIPGAAMPPMPTYAPTSVALPGGGVATRPAMPGYPFYVAALAGHRAPQPPLDMEHDGGLPRHLVVGVPPGAVEYGNRGLFDVEIHEASIKLLSPAGTGAESAAIDFHAGLFPGAVPVTTLYGFPGRGYPAYTPEGATGLFLVNGRPPTPGAPFADPCPPGAPVRTYRAAYVQVDGVVNSAGWHDPQMRTMVLEGDYQATLDGTRPLEPLYIRARSGECVVFHATNAIPAALEEDDFQRFTPTDVIGQHIHLVKFDITSSDGGANGFNYEDGTLAAEEVVARIQAANALGGAFVADGGLGATGAQVLLAPTLHPRLSSAPLGAQTTTQRWWADPVLNAAGQDRTLSTAFTHDHFGPSSHQHHGLYAGLVVEPAGSLWRDPETGALLGARADGGPTSFRADILFPAGDPRPPFREFNLNLADYAIVYDECGEPVNAPTYGRAPLPIAITHPAGVVDPEVVSWRDPGTQLINYRNEPMPGRIATRDCATGEVAVKPGPAGEMHNVFSSLVHGDPATPLLRAYAGERVLVRLLQGAQSEQHAFTIHGKRWLRERSDPDSGYANGQSIGISEQMDLDLDPEPMFSVNSAGGADHLYQSAATDDLWDGMWGILRVHGAPEPDLLPLSGAAPPPPAGQAAVCPPGAPLKSFVVHAIVAQGNLPGDRLAYNPKYGLYDPDAILFARAEDLATLRSGQRAPEPLILRANAGDCIRVTLVNELPDAPPKTPHWNYNRPIVDGLNTNQVPTSNRVSLHPQLVAYDVVTSDGSNVGLNGDRTVGPGGQQTMTWYAGRVTRGPQGLQYQPVELGAINLKDMADVVNHPMHGAIGALIVEPAGASVHPRPDTHAAALISYVDHAGATKWFREIVLLFQDEVGLHTDAPQFQCADGALNCGTALMVLGGDTDSDISGHKAINYRTEPIWARLGYRPETRLGAIPDLDLRQAFSSAAHGDPATRTFTVNRWDTLRVRVLHPSGHRRAHAFRLWGAEWAQNPWAKGSGSRYMGSNPTSFVIGVQSGIGPMTAWNINPHHRAGGKFGVAGDLLYLEQASVELLGGQWGIVRALP